MCYSPCGPTMTRGTFSVNATMAGFVCLLCDLSWGFSGGHFSWNRLVESSVYASLASYLLASLQCIYEYRIRHQALPVEQTLLRKFHHIYVIYIYKLLTAELSISILTIQKISVSTDTTEFIIAKKVFKYTRISYW